MYLSGFFVSKIAYLIAVNTRIISLEKLIQIRKKTLLKLHEFKLLGLLNKTIISRH